MFFYILKLRLVTGLHFQCLFLGETGIGKSTLSDSLFNTTFDSAPENHKEPGVRLKAHTYELQDRVATKNLQRFWGRATDTGSTIL